jgi:hypothetical protein
MTNMISSTYSFLLVWSSFVSSSAFGPHNGSFKIVGAQGGPQYLPASYTTSFSFWSYDGTKILPKSNESAYNGELQLKIRPSLDVLIKGGIPSYFMAGLQRTREEPVLPLAQQWTTFNSLSVENNLRLLLYQGPGDGTDERLLYITSDQVKSAIEALGMILSKTDSDVFSSGFHVLSFTFGEWATIKSSASSSSRITCILTAEPSARELFTLDPGLLAMTATSFLQLPAEFP